jgi:hypothetical protein
MYKKDTNGCINWQILEKGYATATFIGYRREAFLLFFPRDYINWIKKNIATSANENLAQAAAIVVKMVCFLLVSFQEHKIAAFHENATYNPLYYFCSRLNLVLFHWAEIFIHWEVEGRDLDR